MPGLLSLFALVIFSAEASFALNNEDPEKRWALLDQYEAKTGGDIMVTPRNGDISDGMIFQLNTVSGEPVSEAWTQTSIKWAYGEMKTPVPAYLKPAIIIRWTRPLLIHCGRTLISTLKNEHFIT